MQKLALCKNALSAGDSVKLRVTGISMVPALWPGDCVTLRSARASELRLGDVVAFARDGRVIAHRLIRLAVDSKAPILLIARGDSQQHEDLPILPAELLGIVTSVRRFRADRPIDSRPSRMARALSHAVGRSKLARFLLIRIYSRYLDWIPAAQDERAAS